MVVKTYFLFLFEVGMDRDLVFYSILDFFPRRQSIKLIYKSLSLNDKKTYKKYVYSICFEREYVKDLIWEFLNDWEESYEKLGQEYSIKRRKVENDIVKNNIDIDINTSISS